MGCQGRNLTSKLCKTYTSNMLAIQHTPYPLIGLLRRAGSRLRRSESQNSLNLGYSGVGCLRGGFSLKSGSNALQRHGSVPAYPISFNRAPETCGKPPATV